MVMDTKKYSDVPTRGRRACPSGCGRYSGVAAATCGHCGASMSGGTEKTVKAAVPKAAPKTVQAAERGRKRCQCGTFSGVRSLFCKGCQKPFVSAQKIRAMTAKPASNENVEASEGSSASPNPSSFDRFRAVIEGYFAFVSENNVHPAGVWTELDKARLARVHFSEKNEAREMTLYRCETEELARTVQFGIVRENEKKIEIYHKSY